MKTMTRSLFTLILTALALAACGAPAAPSTTTPDLAVPTVTPAAANDKGLAAPADALLLICREKATDKIILTLTVDGYEVIGDGLALRIWEGDQVAEFIVPDDTKCAVVTPTQLP